MIGERPLGRTGIRTTELGMGCSRLGSLLVAGGRAQAERAVAAALERGIRFFDTADIYGQGDSERVLGRVLGQVLGSAADAVTIATKAGYVPPAPLWALRLAKPPMRLLTRLRGGVRETVAARRSQGYAQRFDDAHLARALHGSLRRLGRDRIDVFLLHNPPIGAATDALWRFVDTAKRNGDVRSFGISCTTAFDGMPWLEHPAVEVIQVAAGPGNAPDALLAAASARGIGVIAREILGGPQSGPNAHGEAAVLAALRAVLHRPGVSVALLGMTRPEHVHANAALAHRLADLPLAQPA
ncbi:MAG: aldo/keto reductase [Alphaproteobacteria bacterium]|nr:aldo/keto reductase [Alphaproteobacteria bacterium]